MTVLGFWVTSDDALCADHFDRSEWRGFEDWESPLPITDDDASDTPTHCDRCAVLIAHPLTPDGDRYVTDAVRAAIRDGKASPVVVAWSDAYADHCGLSEIERDAFARLPIDAKWCEYSKLRRSLAHIAPRLRSDAIPYAVYRSATGSDDCDYCAEGAEIDGPHEHEMYVCRDGASARTADNLAAVFVDDVSEITTWSAPEGLPSPDASEWCDDADDSETLTDAMRDAESALVNAGLSSWMEDGYVIERVNDFTEMLDAYDVDGAFTDAYVDCALFASTDNGALSLLEAHALAAAGDWEGAADAWSEYWDARSSGGESLDGLDYAAIDDDALASMRDDCRAFIAANIETLYAAHAVDYTYSEMSAGHDFWLTRNRHGAGFWDRGLPDAIGQSLTDAAHGFGASDLYIGDDGRVYVS